MVLAGEKALPQLGQNAAPVTTLVPHFGQNDNVAITVRDRDQESSYAYRPRSAGCDIAICRSGSSSRLVENYLTGALRNLRLGTLFS